jgi:hypothetical protein
MRWHVVYGVAKRWATLGECRIVLSIRGLLLSSLRDCCLYREVVGLLLGRRSCVAFVCEGLVGVLCCSLLLFFFFLWGGERDVVNMCLSTQVSLGQVGGDELLGLMLYGNAFEFWQCGHF